MITPFLAELIGTAVLLLLGAGVNANINLKNTNAENDTPWIIITSSWGFAVFVGAYIASSYSGAHLNPAVSIGLAVADKFSWDLVPIYILAQLIGAMLGSFLSYLIYIDHYKITKNEEAVKGTFFTSPAIRNFKNNFFSEFMGTFMLVFGIFFIASPMINIEGVVTENYGIGSLESLPVGILVWVIGMSLGGTTGYAINPVRDLGPRIIYQLIPRKNKKPDWEYSWIPIFCLFIWAISAGILFSILV